jgi:integrase
MNESRTQTLSAPDLAAPARGDTVQFMIKDRAATGKVTSAYQSYGGKHLVTVSASGERRASFTRLAANVRVTRPATAAELEQLQADDAARGPLGQRPGHAAPNAGKTYAAEVLTPAEVDAVIGQCSRRAPTGIRNRALVMLLYRSGLRVSEILAIRPSDVDMAEHSIRLQDTKSGKPQTRGYHPSADDALSRWLDTRKALGVGNHGRRLFCTLKGEPLSEDYLRGMVRRLAEKAGVDKRVHPHGFRHTYAVELLRAGLDVVTISKLLGHSGVAVTVRYLDHLTNGEAITALQSVQLPALT